MNQPDWIQVLRQACVDRSSQRKVASQLGISPTSVNLVLNGRYPASTQRIEGKVRLLLMVPNVICPVFGEISGQSCLAYQQKRFSPGAANGVKIWCACRDEKTPCPNSQIVGRWDYLK